MHGYQLYYDMTVDKIACVNKLYSYIANYIYFVVINNKHKHLVAIESMQEWLACFIPMEDLHKILYRFEQECIIERERRVSH